MKNAPIQAQSSGFTSLVVSEFRVDRFRLLDKPDGGMGDLEIANASSHAALEFLPSGEVYSGHHYLRRCLKYSQTKFRASGARGSLVGRVQRSRAFSFRPQVRPACDRHQQLAVPLSPYQVACIRASSGWPNLASNWE